MKKKMMMKPQIRAEEILREQAMGKSHSRAIAIQRPDPSTRPSAEDFESQNISSSLYDWATWRMYNRIVDHRQKHPVRSSLYDDLGSIASTDYCPIGRSISLRTTTAPRAVTPTLQEEYLDGEVFDIEI